MNILSNIYSNEGWVEFQAHMYEMLPTSLAQALNDFSNEAISQVFSHIKASEMIIPYTVYTCISNGLSNA